MKDVGKTLTIELGATALLMFAVDSASIAAHRLSPANEAAGLLASSGATAIALYVILSLALRIDAGYLNPLAPAVSWLRGDLGRLDVLPLSALAVLAQGIGALAGAWSASQLFALDAGSLSTQGAASMGRLISEGAAAAGLVLVLFLSPPRKLALLVAVYSALTYWCTAATAFGNPAAILARVYAEGPMGIAPGDAVNVLLAQLIGAAVGATGAWALRAKHTEVAAQPRRDA